MQWGRNEHVAELKLGYKASAEQFAPRELVELAVAAEKHGMDSATVSLTIRTPTAGSFEAAVVGNGPIAYWRLDETSGTTAFDLAGAHDGAYNTSARIADRGLPERDRNRSSGSPSSSDHNR